MTRKRQRTPHFIRGLGDGSVRDHTVRGNSDGSRSNAVVDDTFINRNRRNQLLSTTMRGGNRMGQGHENAHAKPNFDERLLRMHMQQSAVHNWNEFILPPQETGAAAAAAAAGGLAAAAGKRGGGGGAPLPITNAGPWEMSAFAMMATLILLSGLFIYVVYDSESGKKSSHNHYHRDRKKQQHNNSGINRRKKTDEWSEDELDVLSDECAYRADNESTARPILYYPYQQRMAHKNKNKQPHNHRFRKIVPGMGTGTGTASGIASGTATGSSAVAASHSNSIHELSPRPSPRVERQSNDDQNATGYQQREGNYYLSQMESTQGFGMVPTYRCPSPQLKSRSPRQQHTHAKQPVTPNYNESVANSQAASDTFLPTVGKYAGHRSSSSRTMSTPPSQFPTSASRTTKDQSNNKRMSNAATTMPDLDDYSNQYREPGSPARKLTSSPFDSTTTATDYQHHYSHGSSSHEWTGSLEETPRIRHSKSKVRLQVADQESTLVVERVVDNNSYSELPQNKNNRAGYRNNERSTSQEVPQIIPFVPFLDPCINKNSSNDEKYKSGYTPPSSVQVENLNLVQMESGSMKHWKVDRDSGNGWTQESKSNSSSTSDSGATPTSLSPNDPRARLIHVRTDLTAWSDSARSLQSSIAFSELKFREVIGGGGFGQVWRATWKLTPVAVKVLTGSAQAKHVCKSILEEFAAEINMLSGMRHPNICLYMGACIDPPNRAIVTELAEHGSLWDALRLPLSSPYVCSDGVSHDSWSLELHNPGRHRGPPSGGMSSASFPSLPPRGSWPWTLVKWVALGAARGMAYLHSGKPPILHRDLKSANILLDKSYTAKVCDFGLSRLKAQEQSMTGNCGTVQWMAPEVLASESYNEKADVFSFGIICWELLTRECPYEAMNAIQCALAVLNRDHRPTIPTWCPPSLRALIKSCILKDPQQRPTFAQIILAIDAIG